ncbi:hypothetical protein [Pedobacter yonginense]|uniref:hypothetical protein n=1 Tax=Pedobacter yonginense TaxID=651869 RepID=UPI001403E301|nr:hypothetical protein [Pedobacter yonginense]
MIIELDRGTLTLASYRRGSVSCSPRRYNRNSSKNKNNLKMNVQHFIGNSSPALPPAN